MLAVANTIDTVNKDYQCGCEDTVQRYISRNITYGFHQEIMSGMSSDKGLEIMQAGDRFLAKTRNIPYNCVYKRLTYYDQSISASKAKLFMELSTDNSRYPVLRFYNLSRIGVDRIHQQVMRWYRYFDKLEYMDLSRNKITELQFEDSVKAYEGDYPDFTLDLSYNKISEITAQHIERLSKIPNMFIDLKENPINCSCSEDVKHLLKLIHNKGVWKKESYKRYEYVKVLRCNEPVKLEGKTLISITENDLLCEVDVEYVVDYASIISLSVFALFLIIIIIILAKFRREIRILTYTRFHIILPCQSELLYENKRYDAFVSYSSADQEWVSKTFEDMEESKNESMSKFRFCLHHRDFIPGKTIFDNVIDSVETSRHTVIVLSRNFLNSHYCMYEFHEAFQQSIIERKKHLIVILLEDIPTNELPKDLKRCLKTFTYIRKDDMIFEDRLVFALSYKSNKRLTSRSDSESTSRTMNSQISRETDVTSDGNMSPSVISTDSVFPPIITPDDFLGKTQKCENHL
ncbi:hypothetical protein FSP39_007385 [Pinctada imbricata]|nr:hypothetical protein FSP39_007385 [Pinctada imbricata]